VNTKLVRKSFGRDREAAVAWVEQARSLLRKGEGVVPTSSKQPIRTGTELAADRAAAKLAASRNGVLISELCDGLLKELMDNPEADHRTPPSRIARIKRELGHRVAIGFEPQEIKKWLNGLRSESIYPRREPGEEAPKVNPATANRLRTQLSAIYQFAISEGLLPRNFRNPVRDVKVKKIGTPLKRWMDDAEEAKLREVVQGWVDACGQGPEHERQRKRLTHHLKELDVVLNSGMRKTNMFSIRVPQVDFHRHQVTLGKTKNGNPLVVPMNEEMEAALLWLQANPMKRKSRSAAKPNRAPADSVFALSNPRKWLQKALDEAGITSKFRWHDTRHTVGTRMAQQGTELKTIMEVMGHTTPQAALGYQHMADENRRPAVAGLTRAARSGSAVSTQP
jgi:integrase